MNKTILIIIVILIVIVGGYFLFRGNPPTPAPGVAPGEVEEKTVLPEGEVGSVKEFTVGGIEYSFSPSSINVKAGDQVKITLKNNGSLIHNLIIDGLGIGTRTIVAGQTDIIEFTAPASGTYTFFCSVSTHRAAGMEGQLKVE